MWLHIGIRRQHTYFEVTMHTIRCRNQRGQFSVCATPTLQTKILCTPFQLKSLPIYAYAMCVYMEFHWQWKQPHIY